MFIAPPIKDESSAFAENVDISFNELNGTPKNMDKYLEKTVRDLRSYEDMKNLKVLERGKVKIGYKIYLKRKGSDGGNVRSVIEKFVLDAFTKLNVIKDDNASIVVGDKAEYFFDKENPRAEITITPVR